MTNKTDQQSLSNLELFVLAKVACAEGANEDELADALTKVAPPDGPRTAREHVVDALGALRRRSLVTSSELAKPGQQSRSQPTAEGNRLVRTLLGLNSKPRWDTVQARCLPALALGISTSSDQASKLGQAAELKLTVLRQRFEVPEATTTIALCDALIARRLNFSGKVTLSNLRAHVLAHEIGLDREVASTKELESLATRVASKLQDPEGDGKRPLRQALGRGWLYRVVTAPSASSISAGKLSPQPLAPSLQTVLPIQSSVKPATAQPTARGSSESITPVPPKPASPTSPVGSPPSVVSADTLLNLVREAIPRIGADGRFGPEKVFVSALWHYIEDDGRLPDLSLDRFKHWLVTFNRDQLVDLVRADSQGDMDGRLLEESEIRDLNSTFHFVIDRRMTTSRGYHAR